MAAAGDGRENMRPSAMCVDQGRGGGGLGSRQALAWPSMGIHQGLNESDNGGGQGK